jgi:hypothetical protein
VALVRVYCGIASAELAPWLTVAVVDDSGRLLDVRHISDDPAGYAHLVATLADRGAAAAPVAMDRHEHLVAQLLAAASRPVAIADEARLRDFGDRFTDESSYEEMQAPPSQRRAVGLARALQAGALYATALSPSWDLDELKPVLGAHAALVAGRQASAVALREVLRELYPAALRAYLDPAELIPLRVLEAFPEPGMIATGHGVPAVIAELAATGLTDVTTATNAVNALGVAVEDLRGHGNPHLAAAVAETVRQAVSAVRACDAAVNTLVASLGERLTAALAAAPSRAAHPSHAPVSPAVPRPTSPAEFAPSWAAPAYETVGAGYGAPHAYAAPPAPAVPTPRGPGREDWSDPGASRAYGSPAGRATVAPPANGHRSSGWEHQFGPPPAPTSPAPQSYGPDTLSFSMDPLTAPLQTPAPDHGRGPAAPARPDGAPDEDLLIYSQAGSVWLTHADDDTQITWTGLSSDDGWRAAAQSAAPTFGPDTSAGLPRRVPQQNLVPGSVTGPARTPRIVRDPRRLAAATEGYFRGWRRGQEVGGFAVGQRDRGAWEFNREQRARQGAARLS